MHVRAPASRSDSALFVSRRLFTFLCFIPLIPALCQCRSASSLDFTLKPTISGHVRIPDGAGVHGIVISATGGVQSSITDTTGYFQVQVPHSWSGSLRPEHRNYMFSPETLEFADITTSADDADFLAEPKSEQDLDEDPTTESPDNVGDGNKPPRANAGPNILVQDLDENGVESITLNAGNSFDPDGSITEYRWTEGDTVLGTEPTFTLDFNLGIHQIQLRVTDNRGASAIDELAVTIINQTPPTSLFVQKDYTAGPSGPVGSITNPYASIKEAAAHALPGDTIYLRTGTYAENFIQFMHSGRADAPISVEGYDTEEVIISSGSDAKWVFDFSNHMNTNMVGYGHYNFRKFKAHGSRHIWRFAFPGDGSVPQPHHITIENVEGWDCGSVLTGRNGGVAFLTLRHCNFYDCWGTEGPVDLSNNVDALDTPQSGSHDILIEDCDFHDNNRNQQCNGIVTQGAVFNVTFKRCRAWNNGKYGFALKGSGNISADRCVSWANGSSQFYLRGMVATDPGSRTVSAPNDHLLTNCIAVAPRDAGGTGIVWRECTNVRLYNCTIVSLRDESLTKGGGPFANSERQIPPEFPIRADLRNCILVVYDGLVMRLAQGNGTTYIMNRRYEGDHNLFYRLGGGGTTAFKYEKENWTQLSQWQNYWAHGEPNGDDGLNGPTATHADANSTWADPLFAFVQTNIELVPMKRDWPVDFTTVVDATPGVGSPAIGAGENLSGLGLPQLMADFYGNPRPENGSWTIGAINGATP